MKQKALFMETTTIDPMRSAGEITAELVRAGAKSVNTDYKDGKVSGLRWIMRVNETDIVFDMPVRVLPMDAYFRKRHGGYINLQDAEKIRAKAERVAWRHLLRWVQIQSALIETGMVQPAEVYLPYMVIHTSGRTLFQQMSESQFKMLAAPAGGGR
jgi:hypothetical protein